MQHIFSLEIVGADERALLRERVAGACCESKLPRVYRPLLAEVTVELLSLYLNQDFDVDITTKYSFQATQS